MLQTLRNASKGWMAIILIIMLIASFGIWGVSDMMNLTEQPKIATVGKRDVPPEEFRQEFARFLSQMSRATGSEMTSEQAKAQGLDRVALDRYLGKLAILDVARGMNMTVSPEQIIEALKPIQGMVDSKGNLTPGALGSLARENNMSEAELVDIITGDLLRQQLLRSVSTGVGMPMGLQRALNMYRLERRVAEFVTIDPAMAGAIGDPDEAKLKAFFDANADAKYSIPETRNVVFVSIRPEDVAKTISVPEADIAKLYEANRKRFEIPEKRTLEQIRFKSEDAARAGKVKLDAGTSFEAVAKAEGLKAEDIKIGEVSKGDTAVPAVAFDAPLNTPTEPARNAFGTWVILRATASTPGSVKSLADAREEIRKVIVDSKVRDEVFEIGNQLEDTIGAGATLEEAAAKLKIPLANVTITDKGTDAAGVAVPGLPGGDFVKQVFAADTGKDPELLQTDEGVYYEFRIDRINKKTRKDLAGVRDQVIADWRAAEVSKRLDAIAADILKRAKAGETLAAIAASKGVGVSVSEGFARFGRNPAFGEVAVNAAFAAGKGGLFSGPQAEGKGLVVGKVTDIQFEVEAPDSPLKAAYERQMVQTFVQDYVTQFENGARAKAGVTIDEARFQAFHNNE